MNEELTTLSLQQILIFLTVVEENGFARAGQKLYMTQPAISKSIAKMEKNLGFLLFTRTTRSHTLTEAGKLLYEEWKPHMEAMDQAYLRAKNLEEQEESILSAGVLNTARPERYFYPILKKMKERYPAVEIRYSFDYMTNLEQELLHSRSYDLILIPDFERYFVESRHLSYCYAARDYMYLLVPREHPLAKRKSIRTEDFADEPMIEVFTHEDQSCYLRDLTERLEKVHKKPDIACQLRSAYDVQYFITSKNVVRLVDNYFDDSSAEKNVKKIKIKDQCGGVICVWNPENRKKGLRDFLDLLSEAEEKNALSWETDMNL